MQRLQHRLVVKHAAVIANPYKTALWLSKMV
jgi:hypothetical protein